MATSNAVSDFAEEKWLELTLDNVAAAAPATIALALCTALPTDSDTGATITEVANANGYARQNITTSFPAAASRACSSNANITFPVATGSWGTISHWAIVDSTTHGAGNVYCYGDFDTAVAITTNDQLVVNSGNLTVTCDADAIDNMADGLSNEFLNWMLNQTAYTYSAPLLHLYTAWTDESTNTEVTGGSYAATAVSFGAWATGTISSDADTTFPTATANWGTITNAALKKTSGAFMFYNVVTASKAINNGDTAKFLSGDVDVTLN